jgi:membrane fusion protein (multidrug efflux system)
MSATVKTNGELASIGNGDSRLPTNGAPPRRRRLPIPVIVLLVVMVIAAIVATIVYITGRGFESTDDAYIEGHVIAISPQVSALVKAVKITDNMEVTKGQVMVQLDPADFQVALDQATASQAAMEGKLAQAKAEITSAQAYRDEASHEVDVAKANAENALSDYNRYKELAARTAGAVSKQQLDAADAANRGNQAQVAQAQAKLAASQADIATQQATAIAAEGDVKKAIADVHKAQVNLSYCTIAAPEDGRVTKKDVEPGSYVEAGEQLFAIVPTSVWVTANFKETQLDQMRVGQPVEIDVDAFPELKLHGKIDSIQSGTGSRFSVLPAENATGNFVKVVQRVPIKVDLDTPNNDANHLLSPGMSVEATVNER